MTGLLWRALKMSWDESKMRVLIPITLCASIIFVLIASGLTLTMRTAEPFAPLDEFTVYLDEQIPALMKLYNIPGSSIALVKDSEVVWLGAYGYANVEEGQKLTTDTPMRVQSISKPVTAWGIMKLAEQGEIDLDSPAAEYLTSWKFPSSDFSVEQVTVRRLLSHTAGLPLGDVFTIYSPEDETPSLEEKLTKEAILIREPSTAFSYSNTGYNLLELIIEEVTGRDFAEYMEQEILTPLGMSHSSFVWKEDFKPPVPTGYTLSGRPVPAYIYPEKASGGLFSTAEDVAAFTIAGMSDVSRGRKVLSSAGLEAMYSPVSRNIGIYGLVFEAYGLGYYVETLPNGEKAVSHGGQGTGIMTHFHAVPEVGDAIVILTNSQRSWPFISCLLTDWAQWRAFPSLGMGKIIWGYYGLCAAVGVLLSAGLLIVLRLSLPSCRSKPLVLKPFRAVIALLLFGVLIWSACQKYLFLSSVYPIMSVWLGGALFLFSAALLVSAIKPSNRKVR